MFNHPGVIVATDIVRKGHRPAPTAADYAHQSIHQFALAGPFGWLLLILAIAALIAFGRWLSNLGSSN